MTLHLIKQTDSFAFIYLFIFMYVFIYLCNYAVDQSIKSRMGK